METAGQLNGYDGRQFDFRVWWVREYDQIRPGNLFSTSPPREVWNPTGGMKEWLYIKQ